MEFSPCRLNLSEDRQFFERYRERFLSEANSVLKESVNPQLKGLRDRLLHSLEEIYNLLFLEGGSDERLENLIDGILHYDLSLKRVFVKPFLSVVGDYAERVIEEHGDIGKVKSIFGLLTQFFDTVERVHSKRVEKLQRELSSKYLKEVERAKREKLSMEKQVIYHTLSRLKDRGERLELKRYYKGIPVFCRASIVDLEPSLDYLYLAAEGCRYKIFFQKGQKIYLKHPDLPKPLAALVRDVDLRDGSIVLTGLYFEELPHEKRKAVRVEPEKPAEVKLFGKDTAYRGLLKDISPHGAGVIFEEIPPLKVGDYVNLKTSVGGIDIDTSADVRYIDEKSHRVGFHFSLPPERERELSRYILRRQLEILKELKLE